MTTTNDCKAYASHLRNMVGTPNYILLHCVDGDASLVDAYAAKCLRAAFHLERVVSTRIGRGRSVRRLAKDAWYRAAQFAEEYATSRNASLGG